MGHFIASYTSGSRGKECEVAGKRGAEKVGIIGLLKGSLKIFLLRTILLRDRVLPFIDRWTGNDLEMSGVL